MAAPASKKAKKTASLCSSEPESLGSSPVKKVKLCIICGKGASSKLVKDSNFDAMMQLYWCTLGVDVKPEACKKTDLCNACFDKVVNFFETNDIIVYFETYFKSLRLELLKKTMKGIAAWENEGRTLERVQQEVKKKYSSDTGVTDAEEEQMKQTLSGFNFETFHNVDDESATIRLSKKNDFSDNCNSTSKQGGKISLKNGNSSKDVSESETENESD